MKNALNKYGAWEWICFIAGFAVLTKLVVSFWLDTLEYTALNGVALLVSILLMAKPVTLVGLAKQRLTKNGTNE